MLQGAELFYRVLGLVLFILPLLELWMYVKIRGPVKMNFSRAASWVGETIAIIVPGLLLTGIWLMVMGSPGSVDGNISS